MSTVYRISSCKSHTNLLVKFKAVVIAHLAFIVVIKMNDHVLLDLQFDYNNFILHS